MRFSALLAAAALAVSAAPVVAADRATPDARLARLLEGRVAGAASSCIEFPRNQSSEIVEGTAIVYRLGGTLWVNRPRSGAASLRGDDILVTSMFGSRLCSLDTVRLVDRGSRFERGFAVLGDFVPYRRPKPG